MKKTKANKLTDSKRVRIAKDYLSNRPHSSYRQIAESHGVTQSQAINAVKAFNSKTIGKSKSDNKIRDLVDIEPINDANRYERIVKLLDKLIVVLENDKDLSITDRYDMTKSLVAMSKTVQSTDLLTHLKGTDVELIVLMMRELEPDISNDRILKIKNKCRIIQIAKKK